VNALRGGHAHTQTHTQKSWTKVISKKWHKPVKGWCTNQTLRINLPLASIANVDGLLNEVVFLNIKETYWWSFKKTLNYHHIHIAMWYNRMRYPNFDLIQ